MPDVRSYLKTDAYASEVPRLLFEQSPQQLEKFLQAQMQQSGGSRADPKLLKWWAAYLESVGELELALKFYALCDDAYSMIRIHLHRGNLTKVRNVARPARPGPFPPSDPSGPRPPVRTFSLPYSRTRQSVRTLTTHKSRSRMRQ